MHETTLKFSSLAALLCALAPALSQASDAGTGDLADSAYSAPATTEQSAPPLLTLSATQAPTVKPLETSSLIKTDRAMRIKSVLDGREGYKETDLWGRIRTGYAIPDVNDQVVAKHVGWYTAHPEHISRTSARASLYLFHVVQELEKRGMPTELALLPYIESGFNPNAYSSAQAAGMWQFVPSTGRDFNLQQTSFKDERRGVLASTDAALTYLQRLYDMFGDWQLALAAYNWGEGSVQRAIKKNQSLGKPTDFESLADLMPPETRNYVPKLQAMKNIIANPGQYGIILPLINNQPYFTAVDKTSDIDVTVAAQLAELSLDEFKALNPQFKRPVITGGEQTKILLPQENAAKFTANLASWGHALSSWTTHKITSAREGIETLAKRFGTTPDALRQANNIPLRMRLMAGSTILVPKTSASINTDISADIADNAQVLFEADRPERSMRAGRKVAPVSLVKQRVPRALAKRRNTGSN